MAEEVEHEPDAGSRRALAAIVDHHLRGGVDAGLAEDALGLEVAGGVPGAAALVDFGKIEIGDVRRSGQMGALVSGGIGSVDEAQVGLGEKARQFLGLDQQFRPRIALRLRRQRNSQSQQDGEPQLHHILHFSLKKHEGPPRVFLGPLRGDRREAAISGWTFFGPGPGTRTHSQPLKNSLLPGGLTMLSCEMPTRAPCPSRSTLPYSSTSRP